MGEDEGEGDSEDYFTPSGGMGGFSGANKDTSYQHVGII